MGKAINDIYIYIYIYTRAGPSSDSHVPTQSANTANLQDSSGIFDLQADGQAQSASN
jgi:hypothetical protein